MKNLIDQAVDEWISSGEYQYTNAIHYLKKRLSNLWISVKDRLPDIGIEVLVYLSSYNGGSIRTDQRYTNQSWMWYEDYDITHWMPLPEPPESEDDAE